MITVLFQVSEAYMMKKLLLRNLEKGGAEKLSAADEEIFRQLAYRTILKIEKGMDLFAGVTKPVGRNAGPSLERGRKIKEGIDGCTESRKERA